jgi:hypothetical protein
MRSVKIFLKAPRKKNDRSALRIYLFWAPFREKEPPNLSAGM